jgi:hypothetical protein
MPVRPLPAAEPKLLVAAMAGASARMFCIYALDRSNVCRIPEAARPTSISACQRRRATGESAEALLAAVSGSQLSHYFADKDELVRAVIDYQSGTITGEPGMAGVDGPERRAEPATAAAAWLAGCSSRAGMPGPVSGCLSTIHSGISVQARKKTAASGMFSQNQVTVTSRCYSTMRQICSIHGIAGVRNRPVA